jgi:hypothetical protein
MLLLVREPVKAPVGLVVVVGLRADMLDILGRSLGLAGGSDDKAAW